MFSTVEHYDYVERTMLKNPGDRKYPERYKTTGYQLAIKNTNLASEIFAGYIGSYSIKK